MSPPAVRIRIAVINGLLGAASAIAAWIGTLLPFGHELGGSTDWVVKSRLIEAILGGTGFVYGMICGAWLGRNLEKLALWMLAGGLIGGITGLAIALLRPIHLFGWDVLTLIGGVGFVAGFLARLVPATPVGPDSLRFAMAGAFFRIAPCLIISIILLVFGGRKATIEWFGYALFGLSFVWAVAGQELRVLRLERRLERLSKQLSPQPVDPHELPNPQAPGRTEPFARPSGSDPSDTPRA